MSNSVSKLSIKRTPVAAAVPATTAPTSGALEGLIKPEGMSQRNWESLLALDAHNQKVAKVQSAGNVDPKDMTASELALHEVQTGKRKPEDLPADLRDRYFKAVNAVNAEQEQRTKQATEEALKNRPFQDKPPSLQDVSPEKQAEVRKILDSVKVEAARTVDLARTAVVEQPKVAELSKVVESLPTAPGKHDPENPCFCMRCGWNQAHQFPEYFSEGDKDTYVQMTLGGKRFVKVFKIFGDKAWVKFRSLTPKEESIALTQLAVDAIEDDKGNRIKGSEEYAQSLTTYRALMAIESLSLQGATTDIEPIFDLELEDGAFKAPNTRLKAVSERIMDLLFPTAELSTIVFQLFMEFDRTLKALRTAAQNPDF